MVSKLYNFSFQSGVLKLLKPSAPRVKETINSTCNWEISSAYGNSNVIMERNHKMSTTFDLCCLWSWSGLYDGFKDSWCGQWNQCCVILSKLSFSFFFSSKVITFGDKNSSCEYDSALCSSEHYLSSSEKKAWKKYRPVWDLNPWPLWYWCSALTTELTSQLGTGHCVGSK